MVFSNNLLFGAAAAATATSGFDPTLIGNSVWLDGSADFLSAELGAKTRTKAVIGTWIQKTGFSTSDATIFSKKGSAQFAMRMQDQASKNGKIHIFDYDGGSFQYNAESTSMLLRDIGWYHIMISIDTTADAGSRLRYYINGIDQTSTLTVTTDYTASDNPNITGGSGEPTQWGVGYSGTSQFIPCYLAQSFMLDDDSIQNGDVAVTDILDAFTFGTNGSQYTPKADAAIAALATTAGGDSFCLDFADSSDLGNDISSNANDFTPSVSMDSTNQSTSTPSQTFAIYNTLFAPQSHTASSYSDGNVKATNTSGSWSALASSFGVRSGKWYFETKVTAVGNGIYVAVVSDTIDVSTGTGKKAYRSSNGNKYDGNTASSYGDTYTTGDIIGVAVDVDGGGLWFSKNGTWQNSATIDEIAAGTTTNAAFTDLVSTLPSQGWFFGGQIAGSPTATLEINMGFPSYSISSGNSDGNGYGNFEYPLPTGFLSLCTANLTAPEFQGIDYFKPVLYTGNGTAIGSGGKAVTGVGWQPDEVWIKNRDATDDHALYDIVRGVTKQLESNTLTAESTEAEGLTAFGSDGFTVGSLAQVNTNTEDYVSWNWLGANSATTTSPAGTIASTSSAADAGHFSVGTYTGQTAAGTVGHGLGGIAEMVIVWDKGADNSIVVYHYGVASDAATDYLILNQIDAVGDSVLMWNDTAPTASVFSVGTGNNTNGNTRPKSFLAFRSVAGVCKVGSYVGNANANGPYINTGFKPSYVLGKSTGADRWVLHDTARSPINVSSAILTAETASSEATLGTTGSIDILSDGFKVRDTDTRMNGSGVTYIYLAMADIGGNGTLPPVYGR